VPDGVYESELDARTSGEELLKLQGAVAQEGRHDPHRARDRAESHAAGELRTMNVTAAHSSYPVTCMPPRTCAECAASSADHRHGRRRRRSTAISPAAVAYRHRISWWLGPNLYRALARPYRTRYRPSRQCQGVGSTAANPGPPSPRTTSHGRRTEVARNGQDGIAGLCPDFSSQTR